MGVNIGLNNRIVVAKVGMILLKSDRDFFLAMSVLDSELFFSVPPYNLLLMNLVAKHENGMSAIVTQNLFYFKE